MKFKLLAILTVLTFSVYSVAYSHEGTYEESYTDLDDDGNLVSCHEWYDGSHHCHDWEPPPSGFVLDGTTAFIAAGVLLTGMIVLIWWQIKKRNNHLLFDASHTPSAARRYLNQLPMQIPVNAPLMPKFEFTRQEHNGWELRAGFTFRF